MEAAPRRLDTLWDVEGLDAALVSLEEGLDHLDLDGVPQDALPELPVPGG